MKEETDGGDDQEEDEQVFHSWECTRGRDGARLDSPPGAKIIGTICRTNNLSR
jgi:hypothetical protein